MKFALILFIGLFAISAQAKPSDTVDALLPQSIYDFVSELLAAAGVLNEKIQSAIHTIKEITESVINQGIQKVSDTWAKVQEQLKEFDIGYVTECVLNHLPALEQAKDKLQADVKTCVQPIVEKSEETKEDLKDTIEVVKETIKGFYDIAKECASFNPLESARCIKSHMGEFKELVMNLIHDSEAKLENAIKGTSELTKKSAACVNDAVSDFNEVQVAIIESIKLMCKKN